MACRRTCITNCRKPHRVRWQRSKLNNKVVREPSLVPIRRRRIVGRLLDQQTETPNTECDTLDTDTINWPSLRETA